MKTIGDQSVVQQGLLVNVFMFRFHILKRLFGPYVQEQAFNDALWAIPTLVFGTAATFFLVARL